MGLLDLIGEKFAKDAQAKLDADAARGQATIKPTERNRLLGLLADAVQGANDFASQPFGYNNPPAKAILGLLGTPAVANTLNEMSYGGALGTGKGMTWKPKADTLDAAMAVAPLAMAAPAAINKTAAAVGKAVAPAVERAVPAIMERGGLPAQFLQDMSQQTVSPLTVWHGSPHKFDKFDASKIGTGEGAQAYGHGLYVAESPEVAQGYREALSKNVTVDGAKLQTVPSDGPLAEAHNMVVRNIQSGMKPDEAISATHQYWVDAANEMRAFAKDNPELAARIEQEALSRLKVSDAAKTLNPDSFYHDPGSLYKIDLPDEHIAKMLDWDKPLSEQPQFVRDALGGIDLTPTPDVRQIAPKSGAHVIERLKNKLGSQDAASNALRDAGIPGIRYLDGGSRGTGAGTSNFVIFPKNEGLLTILERNGQPIR